MSAPELRGEHPTLPRLEIELVDAAPERWAGKRKPKLVAPARPAHARVYFSPVRLLETANPARLRRHGLELLRAAAALEDHHAAH